MFPPESEEVFPPVSEEVPSHVPAEVSPPVSPTTIISKIGLKYRSHENMTETLDNRSRVISIPIGSLGTPIPSPSRISQVPIIPPTKPPDRRIPIIYYTGTNTFG